MGRPKAKSEDLGQATSSSSLVKPSDPISMSKPASRRQNYVSGNHLLNFEVTSSPGSGFGFSGSLGGSARRPHRPRPGVHFTKERFIHANFRFVALKESVEETNRKAYEADPDVPLEWNDIELVLVPAQQDISCPICLDTPLAPRLTRCGHYFCWPCILQYAASTSSAGSGNWRKCPICFESISTRQLKSVRFQQVDDYAGLRLEVRKIGIPMVLLRGQPSLVKVSPTESNPVCKHARSLSDLSPFDKISLVDRQFLIEHIIDPEARELNGRLDMLEEADESRVYIELALTMVDDRKIAIGSVEGSGLVDRRKEMDELTPDATNSLFFHQSADGQPFFLCPLSIKILRRQYGTYAQMPAFLCAPVKAMEMAIMTEEVRKHHRYLHHLPVGCQFGLCEVDLSNTVSPKVLAEFAQEIEARSQSRKTKAAKEAKLAAAALRREKQRLESVAFDVDFDFGQNLSPCVPGVATGILGGIASMTEDYENFPLFPSESDQAPSSSQEPSPPMGSTPRRPSLPTAGSFASIAAAGSPPNSDFGSSFVVLSQSNASPNSVGQGFGFASFDELLISSAESGAASGSGGGRKGKKVVLVSNASRRRAT